MKDLLILPILIPMLTAIITLLMGDGFRDAKRWLGGLAIVATLGVSAYLLNMTAAGEVLTYGFGDWPMPFGIVLVLDRLAALMVTLTSVLALFAYVYAITGPDTKGPSFHFLFLMQITGVNGSFLTGDLFNLFVFFEILLLTAYVLVVYGSGPARTRTGMQYVFLNLLGSSLFLIAIGVIYAVTGTLNMADLAMKFSQVGAGDAMLVRASSYLLIVVFAVKAGLFPLYFWLPHSYGAVTAPVAALFAIMTKVGVYAILRSTTLFFGPGQGFVENLVLPYLLPAALITLVAAVMGAVSATKLRTMAAYLLLASIGTMLAGIGLFTAAGISASLYYLLHSTLVMGALFLVADLVSAQRGPDLRDAFKPGPKIRQPLLLGVFFCFTLIGVLGLPPLSGFLGKAQILAAAVESPWQTAMWATVLLTSLVSLVAAARAGTTLFWNTSDTLEARSSGAGWKALPIAGLLAGVVLLTVFAGPLTRFTEATANQLLERTPYISAVLESP
jgi:multicomponent K+:H+ antiporter subunit D